MSEWQEYLIEAHPKNMRRIAKSWPLKARDGAIRLPGSLWCRGGGSGGGDDGGCSMRVGVGGRKRGMRQ